MDYKHKYLKYKLKYIKLKQYGGMPKKNSSKELKLHDIINPLIDREGMTVNILELGAGTGDLSSIICRKWIYEKINKKCIECIKYYLTDYDSTTLFLYNTSCRTGAYDRNNNSVLMIPKWKIDGNNLGSNSTYSRISSGSAGSVSKSVKVRPVESKSGSAGAGSGSGSAGAGSVGSGSGSGSAGAGSAGSGSAGSGSINSQNTKSVLRKTGSVDIVINRPNYLDIILSFNAFMYGLRYNPHGTRDYFNYENDYRILENNRKYLRDNGKIIFYGYTNIHFQYTCSIFLKFLDSDTGVEFLKSNIDLINTIYRNVYVEDEKKLLAEELSEQYILNIKQSLSAKELCKRTKHKCEKIPDNYNIEQKSCIKKKHKDQQSRNKIIINTYKILLQKRDMLIKSIPLLSSINPFLFVQFEDLNTYTRYGYHLDIYATEQYLEEFSNLNNRPDTFGKKARKVKSWNTMFVFTKTDETPKITIYN